MRTVKDELEERISKAMKEYAQVPGACPAIVRLSTDPKFGDYQVNGAMALAKRIKEEPLITAQAIANSVDLSEYCEPLEVAGPGFINLRLKPDFITDRLLEINKHIAGLGIDKAVVPKTIVVDFSSPNIAKQMHVGHLRSTIIGDCICRILEILGHKVIRQNHIGDWGTQFGMLCALYDKKLSEKSATGVMMEATAPLADIEAFYREAKVLYDSDEEFANTARAAVVGLHSGNKIWVRYWEIIRKSTLEHCQELYDQLGATLCTKDVRGESEYNKDLPDVVKELKESGLATDSDGAVCVFLEGFKNKEGQPLPFIIQKSDGAYLYATTDLAALRYRINELKANTIIYVTDSRQKLHFEMLFKVAKMAGWASDDIELSHVMFGSVLGEDGTPLKTRSGENVKLKDLLDEAVERAKQVVEQKNPELSEEKKKQIAQAVGIGAVKYADYSNNRTSDYVFSFDKILAMDGNTAPYMQYAYARISSIMGKGKDRDIDTKKEISNITVLNLTEPAELDLAKYLIRYGEAIQSAASDYRPNYLTAYLYELAQKFSTFYTNCPVLKAEPDKRPTRLLLCDLTAKTIKHGLSKLLGIEVVEQM